MANNLGQPTIQDVSNVMCDQCNAVICLGCPVYELDKHTRAQQNAHPTVLSQSETAAHCLHCQGQIIIGLPETAQRVA